MKFRKFFIVFFGLIVWMTLCSISTAEDKVEEFKLLSKILTKKQFGKLCDNEKKYFEKDYNKYKKRQKHLEWIIYDATNPNARKFIQGVKNVTKEDEVFLLIKNSNPIQYSYDVKITVKDAPEGELLNIHGTIPDIPDFIQPALDSTSQAKEPAETVGTLAKKDKEELEKKEESVKKEIEKIKIKIQTKRELSPREQEINQFAPKFKSLRALYTQYTKYLSDIEKLIGKITELEKSIEELRQKISDFKEKIVIFGRSENLEDELYKIYKNNYKPVKDIYQELEASLQDIENVGNKISKEVKEYKAEIPSGMLSVIKIKDTEIDKGLLNFKECLRKVKKDIEEIGGLFSSIKKVLQSFEQCIRIGNFEEGKRVTVKITQKKKTAQESVPSHSMVIKGAKLKHTKKDDTTVEITGKISDLVLKKVAESTETASKKADEEVKKSDKDKPKDQTQEVGSDEITFDIIRQQGGRLNLGYIVSWVAAPDFAYRSEIIPVDEEKGTPAQKEITVYRSEGDNLQVFPAFHYSLYFKPRYLFAQDDSGDPFESVHSKIPEKFHINFGFSMANPAKNFLLGLGFDIHRGVAVIAGFHFSKVKRLVKGYTEDEPFTVSEGADFDLQKYLEESFRVGFYLTLSVDPGALLRVFGQGEKKE